ncbi:hypothetical protein C8R44DRAFT_875303 [Mycena epipterygia]|nr:hypothetical protein C8R44DRAFT_875303 [Mycena epipterygia]
MKPGLSHGFWAKPSQHITTPAAHLLCHSAGLQPWGAWPRTPHPPAHTLVDDYTSDAVLQYHTLFFNRRSREMEASGNCSGWSGPDIDLLCTSVYPYRTHCAEISAASTRLKPHVSLMRILLKRKHGAARAPDVTHDASPLRLRPNLRSDASIPPRISARRVQHITRIGPHSAAPALTREHSISSWRFSGYSPAAVTSSRTPPPSLRALDLTENPCTDSSSFPSPRALAEPLSSIARTISAHPMSPHIETDISLVTITPSGLLAAYPPPASPHPWLDFASSGQSSPSYSRLLHAELFPPRAPPPLRLNTGPRVNAAPEDAPDTPTISTSLNEDTWAYYLHDYRDHDFVSALIHIVRHGINLGFTGSKTTSQSCTNLKSACDSSATVLATDISAQVSNGWPIPSDPVRKLPLLTPRRGDPEKSAASTTSRGRRVVPSTTPYQTPRQPSTTKWWTVPSPTSSPLGPAC